MTRLNLEDRWPSLADQANVATTLFGDDGERLVAEWLDIQLGFVGDADFAAGFSDHITLPGIAPLDYAHRHLRTPRGELVGVSASTVWIRLGRSLTSWLIASATSPLSVRLSPPNGLHSQRDLCGCVIVPDLSVETT